MPFFAQFSMNRKTKSRRRGDWFLDILFIAMVLLSVAGLIYVFLYR